MTKRDSSGRFAKSDKTEEVSKARRPSGRNINTRPIGNSGLKQANGYVQEEYLRELAGPNAAKVYKEMYDNDPIVGAMFFGIEMFCRRVQWFVDPFGDSDEHEEKAKFLRECKDDMSHTWSDFIAEVFTMMPHGWSYFEMLFKRRTHKPKKGSDEPQSKYDDGKIGLRKIEIRAQESLDRWEFDEEGGLAGMWQELTFTAERKFIPIQKSLLFRTTSRKNNPEGRSVLRNAYRPWYFKKRIEEIEGVGIERDLAGLPFAEVPAEMLAENASEADKETLASIIELVKNVRRDEQEGVIWPQSWDENGNKMYEFKLMSSGGTRQFDTSAIIQRYETRMAMVILADFILLGAGDNTHSFAMATTKSGLFQSALSTWMDVIQDVLNNYLVPRLFRLNGDFSGEYPKFRHDEVQKPSIADLATVVAALAGAGAQLFPDVDLENHFRRLLQFPLRESKPEEQHREDELRENKLDAEIATAKETIKNPGGPPPAPLGKQPGSVPGAPTKTTGRVKSKLPPQERRRTKAVNAGENVAKRRVVVRRKK